MRHFRFREGKNCWRLAHTGQFSVLVDGAAYFAAARRAMIAARRRIHILAWDIHSRVRLQCEDPEDDLPLELGDLLLALLQRRPELEVYILLWSYAPIYALEREPPLFGKAPWRSHPRLHVRLDDRHPMAASHHQKLLIVDETLAFCGGFDLSKWRWDTTAHRAEEPCRKDHEGNRYPPFHDVQVLVDGEAAAALSDLARQRWRDSGAEPLQPLQPRDPMVEFPEAPAPLLRDTACALSRTLPRYGENRGTREVEQLYLDMIGSAQALIYLENQYLTSHSICQALGRRLRRRHGPEVVIVLPRETGDWLEQHTMDVLRGRLLGELREADRHGRLAVYYPRVPDLGSQCLMVHAKLAIVDDRLLRIGSANLSNRSMGLDTECDLSIEAQSDGERAAVAGLRRRLLGMFLELAPAHLAEAESREQGLIPAIESLRGNGRSLAPLSAEVDPEWERQLPDDRLVDPDSPLSTDDLSVAMLGRHHLPVARRRLWITLGMVVALLAMAAAWRWTPLSEWLDPGLIATAVSSTLHGPWGPLLLTLGFVAASLVAVPVTFLILVTALIYGPLTGGFYALLGAVLSALAGYGVGSYLGRPTVERLSGGSLYRLSERLARRGLLTVITVRVVPVAPFAVINLFAGASHIQFRDYVIGTVIGMLPGTAALAVFAEGILGMLEGASLRDFLVILLAVVFIIGMSVLARHLLSLANGQRKKTNHTE